MDTIKIDDASYDPACTQCGAVGMVGGTLEAKHTDAHLLRGRHMFFCLACLTAAAASVASGMKELIKREPVRSK